MQTQTLPFYLALKTIGSEALWMQWILETMTSCVASPGAALEGGAQNPDAICFQDHMALSSDVPGPPTVL